MKNTGFTWRKRVNSFRYAFHGICRLIMCETNARIHIVAAVCVLFAGWLFHISITEWIAIVFCIGLMLSAEAMNSAIETLSDRVTTQYDEAIKHTKDLASGAVLLLALTSVVVGCIIFIPKIVACIV